MVLSRDARDLEQLTLSAPVEELPVVALGLLGAYVTASNGKPSGPMVEVLRRAQRRFPADFWINHELASGLCTKVQPRQLEEGIGFYRVAVALRQQSPGARLNLGNALKDKGDVDGAIAEFREAIRLKKDYLGAHNNLGLALCDKGDLDGAIAEYHEAIRLNKDYFYAHDGLGVALARKGDLDGAIAEYKEAIRLKKDYAVAHYNLGLALCDKGNLAGAIAEYHEAIRLNKDYFYAHDGLGVALARKGDLDGAIAEYKEAIRLKKDYAVAHYNLGLALCDEGNLAGAIAEYCEAIQLKKDYAEAHNNLGVALARKGDLDGAIAEFRKTIDIDPKIAGAHNNLGHVLRDQGQFAEALEELRRGHELGSKEPGLAYRSAQWVKQCERLVELDAKLPKVLKGEVEPTDVGERLALAQLCQLPCRSLHAAAARFYTDAFAEQPALAEKLAAPGGRYDAACAAAQAGCGQGKDADQTDDKERSRLHRQAQDWLRADLAAYRRDLERLPDKAGPVIRERMQHWLEDTDFAGVRGPAALAKLPEAERPDWQKLWQEVEALRQRAAAPSNSNEKPGPK